jgi:mono/diheme cytochrome c family protein
MRNFLLGVVVTLVVVFGGGYLFLVTGMYNPSAIPDPGKLERTIAHEALDSAVDRRAPNQQNPFQPTDENLIQGAMTYEMACSECHGGAKHKISPMAHAFSPRVPQLINRVPRDPDAHLFWVTKNGIKMTGMPAWATQFSDDELWKVILFIKNSNKLSPAVQEQWQKFAH